MEMRQKHTQPPVKIYGDEKNQRKEASGQKERRQNAAKI